MGLDKLDNVCYPIGEMEGRLYGTRETAHLLHVSPATIRNWVGQGLLVANKTLAKGKTAPHRFKLQDINAARQRQGLARLTEDEAVLLLARES